MTLLRPLHAIRRIALALTLAGVLAGTVGPLGIAHAAIITVTTSTDEINADGDCSLREAIVAANTNTAVDACPAGSGADTITLPAGTFTLSLAGINENAAATGDLDIVDDLTLVGDSTATTIIDVAGLDRAFEVFPDPVVAMSRLSITNAAGSTAGVAIRIAGTSSLSLTLVRISDSVGTSPAIYLTSGSNLSFVATRIEDNVGGGLYTQSSTTTAIRSSVFSGNSNSSGGAINNSGDLTIVNSTLSGNTADFNGGAIINGGDASLFNVTVAANTAGLSGTAGSGGGLSTVAGTTSLQNSIVADNANLVSANTQDCSGSYVSGGYNLIEDVVGCTITGDLATTLTGVSANLDALAGNGGGLPTHRLLAGSPAINGGNPAGCLDELGLVLLVDQRNALRNGVCDMGAFEFNSPGVATATATATSSPVPATPTASPTRTNTPVPPTATHTTVPPTATASRTSTNLPPVTLTASATATASRTATATRTPSATPTRNCTPSADNPPCTATPTGTLSATPTATATATATRTPSASPTATRTIVVVTLPATATNVPVDCSGGCLYLPSILRAPGD
ncbi:MAG: CSLREA domain-containing protein [Anaerolineales bacterium]|nr:CSLREA domain-containing protein [Anaerolineales bacterium]